jgi:hypothetical protein
MQKALANFWVSRTRSVLFAYDCLDGAGELPDECSYFGKGHGKCPAWSLWERRMRLSQGQGMAASQV